MRRGQCFLAAVAALALWGAVARGGNLSWSFAGSLEGWQPGNWEAIEATPEGLRGVTRFDAQLLSPKLDIQAEDYPVMLVLLSSSLSGPGETFIGAPGERLSDNRKATHSLTADSRERLYRIDLRRALGGWQGPIERLRFDPLNAAGAEVTISMIALLSDPDAMMINGGIEMLRQGEPFQWTPAGVPGAATVSTESPAAGQRCLRLAAGGEWQSEAVDLSFLGRFRVSGRVRGSGAELRLRYRGLDAFLPEAPVLALPAGEAWQDFSLEFGVPADAFDMLLCFVQAGPGQSDLDDIGLERLAMGSIIEQPAPKPTWQAAWIWHPELLGRDQHRAWFRHEFELPAQALREAALQITADDGYRLVVNGIERVSTLGEMDGWRTPEWVSLGEVLRPGLNTILVEAEDVGSAQGLIAEMVAVFDDGRELRLQTGRHWQAGLTVEGPWVEAAELGRVPCLPWGDLVYRPMGPLGRARLELGRLPRRVRPGERLVVDLEAVAESAQTQPVAARVVILDGDTVLESSWGRELLFAAGAPAGSRARLSDIGIDIPFGLTAERLAVSAELVGATLSRPVDRHTLRLREDERTYEFPRAEVRMVSGVPQFVVNGRPIDPTQNLFTKPDALQQRNAGATSVPIWGVSLQELGWYETGWDYSTIDRTLASYFAAHPEPWIMLSFTFDTRYHRWWLQQHPEAVCQLEGGETVIGDYHGGRRQVPSYGSAVWREAYSEAVRRLIRHLRQTPWAERIIAFHPCSGISWEWFHWGSQSGELVDYSPAGQDDFRRWLRQRYATDEALRQAWGRGEVTLDTAAVPTEKERREPALGLFYDPLAQRHVLDYHDYQHEVVAETILHFARLIKEETGGRSLFGTYYGYVTHLPESPGFSQGSGHFDLRRLLEADEIDYLMAPVAYAWREVGGTAASMSAAGSFPLHGKLFYNQADLRTHWSHQDGHGKPASVRGSIACMRRELARNLAEGSALQWYDFSNGWTFGDSRLTAEAQRLFEAGRVRNATPDWPAEDYLLVVVDEEQTGAMSVFRPPYGGELIFRQREYLARSGVPHRTVLWSDLQRRPELLRHRGIVLLNLFHLDDDEAPFLRDRVMQDGRTVALVGPVGLLGPRGLDASRSSAILGWPMRLVDEEMALQASWSADLAGPWAAAAGALTGTTQAYRPAVLPAETGAAKVLATLVGGTQPAVLWDDTRAGGRVFWSAAPGLRPEALRALAESAGVPVVCRSQDAIYAGQGFIGLHASTAGEKVVTLPRPGAAVDILTGRRWPEGTREVRLDLQAGDTVILRTAGL